MRAEIVVVVTPSAERLACMGEALEDLFIKELVAQTPIETFDEGVLCWLAGSDVMPADAVLLLHIEHRPAGEFCPIVTDDRCWLAVEADDRIELAGNALAGDRRIGDQAEGFAREVIDNREDAEPAPGPEHIGEKVEAPALRRPRGDRQGVLYSRRTLAAPPALHGKTFLPIEPPELLVVHDHSLPRQHYAYTAIAEPAPLAGAWRGKEKGEERIARGQAEAKKLAAHF